MRWPWRKPPPPPEPPRNVCLISRDGDKIPVDCVYLGFDGSAHIWGVLAAPSLVLRCQGIWVEALPPHTAIGMQLPINPLL